jgi:hypothetical protein
VQGAAVNLEAHLMLVELEHSSSKLVTEMDAAKNAMRQARERIHELETALNRMICAHENTLSDSEGRWPQPDCGCIYCTQGQVPDKLNTGPCAYHTAKGLLGQL